MNDTRYQKSTFLLALGGVLFSGYLSAVKLFTSTCALNEPCPYFLGYPACWYGFAMFSLLFLSALTGIFKVSILKTIAKFQAAVAAAGIIFAGYFTVPEVGKLLAGQTNYTLGLPTCAYGLVFYIIIFILAFKYINSSNQTI